MPAEAALASAAEWYEDHRNVASLIRWLGDICETVGWGPEEFARLMDEPWHWTDEWNDLCKWEREMRDAD